MKRNDIKALTEKTKEELHELLKNARQEVASLKLDKSLHKLTNTRVIFLKRKEIAQISTAIRGKELSA